MSCNVQQQKKTLISVHSAAWTTLSGWGVTAKTQQRDQKKKNHPTLLLNSTTVNQCIYLRNVLRGTSMLVFGRCSEAAFGVHLFVNPWERQEMRVVGTHACTPSVCLIHHESWKALERVQGYLVSPPCCSASLCDDRILPQRGWSASPTGAGASLEGK